MSMKMGWRWYGEGNDPITLGDIKQIPGVEEIVWALHSKMPGEIWEEAEIKEVVDQIHAAGFDATVVESVNVHDDINARASSTNSSASSVTPELSRSTLRTSSSLSRVTLACWAT